MILRFVLLLAAAPAALVSAQQAPAPAAPRTAQAMPEDEDTITVSTQRLPGQVVGDIKPELTLGTQELRALGAGSITEILAQIAPQTQSGRGRGGGPPAVLLNGKRTSGFQEIRNIPPEAIARVEVLPEEVALKYGFRADQRVINFVLRPRFQAWTGEFDIGGPTDGGRFSSELEVNLLRLRNGTRTSIEAEVEINTMLTEAERRITTPPQSRPFALDGNASALLSGAGVVPGRTVLGVPAGVASPTLAQFAAAPINSTDIRPFRSLLPDSRTTSLNGTIAGSLGTVGATLTGGIERTLTESMQGLPAASFNLPAGGAFSPFNGPVLVNRYAPDPLGRFGDNWNSRLGTVLDGTIGKWRWNLTSNWNHAENRSRIERGIDVSAVQSQISAGTLSPYGAFSGPTLTDSATSISDNLSADLLLNGSPLQLPAGPLALALKAQVQHLTLDASATRAGLVSAANLSRTQGNFQANFDLPIASSRDNVLAFLGKFTLNGNIAADTLSDFGTLITWGAGANWEPSPGWSFIASFTREQGEPSVGQLGDPTIITPNVRVFDFLRGETVDINRLDGGNRALLNDTRQVWKLGFNLKPFEKTDIVLNANYIHSRIDDPIASFPTATAELEAAFPNRFTRDASGRLLQIDNRPVNFDYSERQELRWGFTLTQQLKPGKAERAAAEKRIAETRAKAVEAFRTGQPLPPEIRTFARNPYGFTPGQRPPGAAGGPPAAGATPPAAAGGPPAAGTSPPAAGAAPPPGGGFGGGFRGGGGGGGPPRGFLDGRLQFTVFHTWTFRNEIGIRPGVPVLDLLNGSAVGSAGGAPRHQIETRLGGGRRGIGGSVGVNWQSGTSVLVDPSGASQSPDDLFFSPRAVANLRLFVDLGQRQDVLLKMPWLRGSRVSLRVDNLFNDRVNVKNRLGAEPIGFQRDQLDPLGRTVTLSLRKLFF
ncbi:TonB-dependent receptor domain-containing protein [Sandarakinorhabdus limnophila]|uniref:TonB-dependent receptor domain-containing protein n=1 Tax=Sandarakinorhabdus limnophila TaxID=210512 RepID=UPI0004072454|nr:TonB-dependent receptor [Sandarakinorhabdus limnophila]